MGLGPAWYVWASVWADHPAPLTPPAGSQGATRKYKMWMRHRYHSCCNCLGELLAHPSFQVKVSLGVIGLASSLCILHTPSPQTLRTQQWPGAAAAGTRLPVLTCLGKEPFSFFFTASFLVGGCVLSPVFMGDASWAFRPESWGHLCGSVCRGDDE